jgi:predicted transcriptional regulator
MARIPFTLRIDPAERKALESLSKVERRPINQLLNDAIKNYLRQKGQKESSLEASLSDLEAYRKKDRGFRRAIEAFVEAEASVKDPLEGRPFEGTAEEPSEPSGPVQSKVREVLGA